MPTGITRLRNAIQRKLIKARLKMHNPESDNASTHIQDAENLLNSSDWREELLIERADIHFHYYMFYQLRSESRERSSVELCTLAINQIVTSLIYELLHIRNDERRVESKDIFRTRSGKAFMKSFEAYGGFFPTILRAVNGFTDNPLDFPMQELLASISTMVDFKIRAVDKLREMSKIYDQNEKQLKDTINRPSISERARKQNCSISDIMPNQIILFKRWNSVDPNYPGYSGSLGGGYYLWWEDTGIVIDPGYEFLSQFFCDKRKFGMGDIHAIVTTHAHDDHSHQVETIYSLSHKYREDYPAPPFYGSEGTVVKFSRLLANTKTENLTLETSRYTTSESSFSKRFQKEVSKSITMKWMQTIHNEMPWMKNNTGVALRFDLRNESDDFSIGITGDGKYLLTKDGKYPVTNDSAVKQYYNELRIFFKGCKLLIVHVGSPENSTSHMDIVPAANLIGDSAPELAIITEFGLNFREQEGRIEAMKRVQSLVHSNTNVFSGDSGLCIRMPKLLVLLSEGFDNGDALSNSRCWIHHSNIVVEERNDESNVSDLRLFYKKQGS